MRGRCADLPLDSHMMDLWVVGHDRTIKYLLALAVGWLVGLIRFRRHIQAQQVEGEVLTADRLLSEFAVFAHMGEFGEFIDGNGGPGYERP